MSGGVANRDCNRRLDVAWGPAVSRSLQPTDVAHITSQHPSWHDVLHHAHMHTIHTHAHTIHTHTIHTHMHTYIHTSIAPTRQARTEHLWPDAF